MSSTETPKIRKLEIDWEESGKLVEVDALKVCVDDHKGDDWFSPCASCGFYKCEACSIYEDICQYCWFSEKSNLECTSEEVHKL